jgi:hypothetical protein
MALIPFANVSALLTPEIDHNFDTLGGLVVIPCTASGTDTINLTPVGLGPGVTSYNFISPIFGFNAAGTTTTSPVTISVAGIGPKNVYKDNGATLIGPNDFILTRQYYVGYNPALGSGAGGWVVLNPGSTAPAAGSVQGTRKRLVVIWASTTTATITADALSVSDGAGAFTSLLAVSETVNSALVGAGGLDTGTLAATTCYGIYIIYNPSTLDVSSVLSTHLTSMPTLPSGYSQYALVGVVYTDGSKHFIGFVQRDTAWQYSPGNNLAGLPSLVSGISGDITIPTWTAVSVAAVIPTSIASKVKLVLANTAVASNTTNGAIVAPNNGYGVFSSTTNPPPLLTPNASAAAAVSVSSNLQAEFVLESVDVYYASDSANTKLFCLGCELML